MTSLLLISLLVLPAGWMPSTIHAQEKEDIPVLLYHRIVENPTIEWTDTSLEKFKETMAYLHQNGYNTLSSEQYVRIMNGEEKAPEKPILLTFDDATPDFITNALPILKQYNMQAVLFVVSDWIDGDYSMTKDQLESLVNEESISLENHSKTHDQENVWHEEIAIEQASAEIAAANQYLKSITNKDPVLMAYPYGTYNGEAEAANKENSIKYAFKVGYPDGSPYAMGRHYVLMDTTLEEIAQWIGGPAPEEQEPPVQQFSTIDYEDQSMEGIEGRSGTEVLAVTDEANHTEGGSFALKVEERTETWHGPALRVDPYIDTGEEYNISVWVKLLSEESTELQLSTQVGQGDNASYHNLDGKTITTEDGWVQLQGSYRYSSTGDGYLTIYVESTSSTASFYMDDITFEPANSGGTDIEKDLPSIKDVYKDDFLIGNAISTAELEGSRLELLKKHHQLVTAENAMKPAYAYNEQRKFDFTAEDELVDKALEEGFQIHGHVLVWHQQSEEWLHSDENGQPLSREEALNNLRKHVQTTVEHFGPNVISWDVVNEAMNDNPPNPSDWKASLRQSGWYKAIGPDYIEQAFRIAKEVIEENGWDIPLYYNDYNDDNQNKAEAIYQMVKEINENYGAENNGELLIDGIGMQAHYNLNTNPENVRRSLEKFISLGVEVGVTELDITAGTNNELTEGQANAQGYLYAQLFKLYKEHKKHISRVTFWGLNDTTSWRAEQSPLLFDKNLQAKPAYYAVIDPEKFLAEHELEEKEANQGTAAFGAPKIDGTVDDSWSNAAELPVNRYQMAWQGANGTAKALWDKENLYVLVEVKDSALDKTSENAWEQDSIEVFVDENNGKTSYYEVDDGQYRVNFDNEASFNPGSIAEGFKSATNQTHDGYIVEVKIPFKTITPVNETKIGFDVQINDGNEGARQSIATWNDTTGTSYQDTSVFGELTLKGVEIPEEPDIEKPDDEPTPKNPGQEKPELEPTVITKPKVEDNQATVNDAIFDQLAYNGELIIDLSEHSSSIAISFTEEQVKLLKQLHALIMIKKKDVTLQIPASIFTNGNQAVDIILQKLEQIDDALSAVYDFNIIQGDKKEISEFDSNIIVSFVVNKAVAEHSNSLKIFYLNPQLEKWEVVGGEYKNGNVTAKIDHFSTFTVFEEDMETMVDAKDEKELPDTSTSTFNFLLGGLILLLIGASTFLFKRKRKREI